MPQSSNSIPLLETENLVCGYKKNTILREVNFAVYGGQHWAVVGKNGGGKSTLLRTLVGLLKPLGGKCILNPTPNEVALVPQHPTRDFRMPMTVEDFVELGFPQGDKTLSSERKSRVDSSLNRLGLSQRKEDISILSGGQFQRTVLARAMVHQPCLMFLDEPARGLDEKSNALFMEELKCCPKHPAISIVMVLHDLRSLRQHFSHVLWVHDGTTRSINIKDIEEHPDLMEFLGNAL